MAILINGLNVSYAYDEMFEIVSVLRPVVKPDQEVFVVRKKESLKGSSYRPVVDILASESYVNPDKFVGYMMKFEDLIAELEEVDSIF